VIEMRKWDEVKIVLMNGKEMSLPNSYFKMRTEDMFCIENDLGEGNCIPVDNISSICLKGSSSIVEQPLSTKKDSSDLDNKKRGLFSKLIK
jgi:hypothetical protein